MAYFGGLQPLQTALGWYNRPARWRTTSHAGPLPFARPAHSTHSTGPTRSGSAGRQLKRALKSGEITIDAGAARPAGLRADGQGVRHAAVGAAARPGARGRAADPVPDQPVEDHRRTLRATARRAGRPVPRLEGAGSAAAAAGLRGRWLRPTRRAVLNVASAALRAGPALRPPLDPCQGPRILSFVTTPSRNDPRGAMSARLFVVSGPSGVGKGTLIARSCASRAGAGGGRPRPPPVRCAAGEQDGREYHFLSDAGVRAAGAGGRVPGACNIRGSPVRHAAQRGRSGAGGRRERGARDRRPRRARDQAAAARSVLVFVAPPTIADLEQRLRGAGRTDPPEEIADPARDRPPGDGGRREFDHVIVNDDIETRRRRADRADAGRN